MLTALPTIAAAVSLLGQHWHPASDLALQLLQIDDVGGRHTPLTGAHSRYGWDHPGPLLFWALAPFDWLFGTTGILAGTAVLNTAAIAGALLVARRRGGVALSALVAIALLVLTLANGTDLFVNPWNPWVAVLPFFTVVLLAWSVADGDFAMLPWLVGVGSFVVQAHVGYAPLVLAAAAGAGAMAWPTRRGEHVRRNVVLSIGVAGVLWLPPILEQVFSEDGNLASILGFFGDPPEAPAGWRLAWGIMGAELGPPGAWLAGEELGPFGVVPDSAVPGVVFLAITLAAGFLAARRGAAGAGRLAVLVVALCAIGVIATSRITGIVGTYLVRWWWVLAALLWLSIGWSLLCLIGDRRARQGIAVAATAIAAALSIVLTVRAVPAGVPDAEQSAIVGALTDELTGRLDTDVAYVVDWTDAELWGAVGIGVAVELERRGYDVSVPPPRAPAFGEWRTARPDEVAATVLVTGSTDLDGGFEPPPGSVQVARVAAPGGEEYVAFLRSR